MICWEERWPISQRRRAKSVFLNGLLLGLICIGIQGMYIYTRKAQSLSGSNDQTIGNIQRTMRAYSDRGQIDIVMSKGHKTLGNKLIPCLDPYHLN